MRGIYRLVLFTVLSQSVSTKVFALELKTERDKLNYALGFQAGRVLSRHSVPFKSKPFLEGVKDGHSGKRDRLELAKAQKCLDVLVGPAEPTVRVLSIPARDEAPPGNAIVPAQTAPIEDLVEPVTEPTPAEVKQATTNYLRRRVRGR